MKANKCEHLFSACYVGPSSASDDDDDDISPHLRRGWQCQPDTHTHTRIIPIPIVCSERQLL